MICVADFVSALIAINTILTVITAIVDAAVIAAGELAVNSAKFGLAAVVAAAIKAVAVIIIIIVAAASITLTCVKRSPQF
jgi:hypothetical protein